jgi:hypothetical protein
MEVLGCLPAVIAQLRATMTGDEITHHRIWHSSSATIIAKTLALALLPVFDLVRPHDLIHYREEGFPKLVGRPCGYSSLAHFVSDLIAIEVHEEWQAALARRYLKLWYNDPTDPDRKCFYADAFIKPVWSRLNLPTARISRDGRILPATKHLFIHGHRGHPLFALPRPGDAHLGQELMGLWHAFAAAVGPSRVDTIIADREIVSVDLFRKLDGEGRHFITGLRSNQYKAGDFTLLREWQDYRQDAEDEPLISQIAPAHIELRAARSGQRMSLGTALIKDLSRNGRLVPIITNREVEERTDVAHIADLYQGHWNAQERSFREMIACANLRANHGYRKRQVPNRVVQRRREKIETRIKAKEGQIATAERRLAEQEARRRKAQTRHEQRLQQLAEKEARWSSQLDAEKRPSMREKLVARLGRVEAERREREAKHKDKLKEIRKTERSWQKRRQQLVKARGKFQQVLDALNLDQPLYEIVYDQESIMTTVKILLTNAHLYAREHYFSPDYAHAHPSTLDELFYQRSGWIVEHPDQIEVILKGYRDSALQSQAQAACQRVNERRVIMPDGRLLRMRVSNPPGSNFQIC